jgi:nitrite reductase (NADH) small subunit
LGEGTLEHEVVACPWHGWKFNVRTGQRLKNPNQAWTVQRYEVRVVDGAIQVLVPST